MKNFKQFRRTQIAEMRPVTEADIVLFKYQRFIHISGFPVGYNVSISDADKNNGSPKLGDMIARNPNDYSDQWLVAEQYFKDNFETIEGKSDNTETLENALHQIQKLEVDKAELLEALEDVKDYLGSDVRSEIESLIQKHKK